MNGGPLTKGGSNVPQGNMDPVPKPGFLSI